MDSLIRRCVKYTRVQHRRVPEVSEEEVFYSFFSSSTYDIACWTVKNSFIIINTVRRNVRNSIFRIRKQNDIDKN